MNKKETELQKDIERSLEHEENLQKDQNEDPITFVKEKRDQGDLSSYSSSSFNFKREINS